MKFSTKTIINWFDHFVPTEFLDRSNPKNFELRRKAHLIIGVNFIISFFALLMFLARVLAEGTEKSKTTLVILIGSILYFSLPYLLKKTKNLDLTVTISIAIACIIICIRALSTGGVTSPVTFWFFAVPLASTFIGSVKIGIGSTILSFILIFFITFADQLGIPYNPMSTSPVVYLLVVMLGLLMSVIISVYSESERLENEKKIRKTERDLAATKKMASLGIFSGGVAHEVNNPMSVILGSVHILKNLAKKEEIENPVVHKCLQHIEDHVHRIRTVTHSLQQYAEGVDSANFGVHNLRKIVEAAFYMAQGNNNSVTFKNNLPEDEDISIYCHDKLLTQAFYNLLMNSLEAIAGREHQWISLECSSTKTCVTIKIQDSGDGITPEVIDKMFFPFYTSKEVGEGVGLGLTLAEGIIDQHDGKLSFNPAAEHTEFIVEIPITHQG